MEGEEEGAAPRCCWRPWGEKREIKRRGEKKDGRDGIVGVGKNWLFG
jgi:hypothetical protein